MKKKEYSKNAITSFVLGLIGILFLILIFVLFRTPYGAKIISYVGIFILAVPFICIISAITGVKGIMEIRKNKNLKGMWLIIPSLIIWLLLLVAVVFIFLLAWGLSQAGW